MRNGKEARPHRAVSWKGLAVAGALGLALNLPVRAQDDVMRLAGSGPAKLRRPAVVFAHARHAEAIDCLRCHHDIDDYGVNRGSDGQPCGDCHTPEAGDNPVPLTRAFHLQCKGCHQDQTAAGRGQLPLMCGQCHRPEADAPAPG